ncbi:hypothetical protein HY734_03675 [Candidatus Uhrbacteria bacterium]|nr:hypothetical protein [Candidatus Uhrbacteria bacterium]
MHIRRLLFLWLASFIASYAANAVAVIAWTVLQFNDFFLLVGLLNAPFFYLLFGWLYFRPGFARTLSQRIGPILIWIALDFAVGMAVFALIDGSEPKDKLSTASVLLESGNFLALLLAAYLAAKPREPSAPPRRARASKAKDEAADLFTPTA